jgi:hypothetical protein
MSRIAELTPLKAISIPDAGRLVASGLTVIVGANSSGKTQLLKDIQSKFLGEPRKSVVASEIEVDLPDYQTLMDMLTDDGYTCTFFSTNGEKMYQSTSPHLGIGAGGWAIPDAQQRSG